MYNSLRSFCVVKLKGNKGDLGLASMVCCVIPRKTALVDLTRMLRIDLPRLHPSSS